MDHYVLDVAMSGVIKALQQFKELNKELVMSHMQRCMEGTPHLQKHVTDNWKMWDSNIFIYLLLFFTCCTLYIPVSASVIPPPVHLAAILHVCMCCAVCLPATCPKPKPSRT